MLYYVSHNDFISTGFYHIYQAKTEKKNGPVSLEAIEAAQRRPMGKKVGIRVLNIYFFHYSSLL